MNELRILVLAEHAHVALRPATARTLGAARRLDGEIDVLVIGHACTGAAQEAAGLAGVRRVRCIDAPHYAAQTAENLAIAVAQLAGSYSHLLLPASSFGKDLAPRVAALLDVGQLSDVVGIVTADTFVRPIYAGNALATVQSLDPVKVVTVRLAAFEPVAGGLPTVAVEAAPAGPDLGVVRVVAREATTQEGPSLDNATVVVAGGRGLESRARFEALLTPLARRLGAAIGASRAAVDAGFIGNEAQIGQTGRVVAPALYLALGISGAIQHVAGMQDAQLVVAIDKDPDAPIFGLADYGLVGDLAEILPQLMAALGEDGEGT